MGAVFAPKYNSLKNNIVMKKRNFNLFCDNCIFREGLKCSRNGFEFEVGFEARNRMRYSPKCDLWMSVDEEAFERKAKRSNWTTFGMIKFMFDKRFYLSREYPSERNSLKINLDQFKSKLINEGYVELYKEWAGSGFATRNRPVIKKTNKEEPWTAENFSLTKSMP